MILCEIVIPLCCGDTGFHLLPISLHRFSGYIQRSPPVFSEVCVAQSLVFCVVFWFSSVFVFDLCFVLNAARVSGLFIFDCSFGFL